MNGNLIRKIAACTCVLLALFLAACSSEDNTDVSKTASADASPSTVSSNGNSQLVLNEEPVNNVEVVDVEFIPPDGFREATALAENQTQYVAPDNPQDESEFNVTISSNDPGLTFYTKEAYQVMMEEALTQAMPAVTNIMVEELEWLEMDGHKVFKVIVRYDLEEQSVTMLQYTFSFASDVDYVFTYKDISNGEARWMNEFEKSANSIHFITEA